VSELEPRLAAYLAHQMPGATQLVVDQLARIHGGGSQEMFRFRAAWREGGVDRERRLILRRAPSAGLVEAERDLEYTVYRALAASPIPVPAAHWLELDGSWLERPFFIMDQAPGKPGHPYVPGDPYDGHGDSIARQFWRHLGTLAALDHRQLRLQALRNGDVAGGFWSRELDYWQSQFDQQETLVDPIVRGALRHLRRHPPPEAAKPAVVHGDYRAGNFLFTPDGRISAILDWEMCHVGDPLEDIAWAVDPMWPMTRHLPLDEGLAEWQSASGMAVDRRALDWWRLFAAMKASVLWATAARSFTTDPGRAMVLPMSALNGGHIHRQAILDWMAAKGVMA
jgi:aminoglycoside phosphotransferase (APT) family kinase protein